MTTGEGARRPASVEVQYGGRAYARDLRQCRRVLREREIEGRFRNMREFAASVDMSLAMVSAWLGGSKLGTKDTTDRILAGLGLDFAAVHRELGGADAERGP